MIDYHRARAKKLWEEVKMLIEVKSHTLEECLAAAAKEHTQHMAEEIDLTDVLERALEIAARECYSIPERDHEDLSLAVKSLQNKARGTLLQEKLFHSGLKCALRDREGKES